MCRKNVNDALNWDHEISRRFALYAITVTLVGRMVLSQSAADIIVTNNLALEKGATLKARLVVRASHVTIDRYDPRNVASSIQDHAGCGRRMALK